MLVKPETKLMQKSICFSMNNIISKKSTINLKGDREEIITFKTGEDFSTLIIRDYKIKTSTYNLFVGDEKTK